MELPDDYTFPDIFSELNSMFPNRISEINSYKLSKEKMKKIKEDWPSDYSPWYQATILRELRERQTFDYDDVQLIPKKGILESRLDADTTVKFGGYYWELPVLPANMSSIIDSYKCTFLAKRGYLYCMHRFSSEKDRFDFAQGLCVFNECNKATSGDPNYCPISMAFGVKESEFTFAKRLRKSGIPVDLLWIDIAHGYSVMVEKAIKKYRSIFPDAFIIAGNVAEVDGALFLQKAGADAVKLGIGHGEACTTRLQTGFSNYNWQLSAVADAAAELDIPIVCDGGIRCYGDIAKALVMGADVCMAGSLFAALEDSPTGTVVMDGIEYAEYYGSASRKEKGARHYEEGKAILKPVRHHTIFDELAYIKQGLQSAISYAGGKDLTAFRSVEYVITKG